MILKSGFAYLNQERSPSFFRKGITAVLAILSFCIFDSSLSLLVGLMASLLLAPELSMETIQRITKKLLPLSIIGLGFGMNLQNVIEAGSFGIIISIVSILGTLVSGFILGRLLRLDVTITYLLSVGTAICGGSAIAAVAPAIGAKNSQIAVSLGIVFLLNALALLTFPAIGSSLGMNDFQFGLWAAIAIHDTSSVVGAASRFSDGALEVAIPVKMVRALWIIPLVWFFGIMYAHTGIEEGYNKNAKRPFPWFIIFFLCTSMLGTFVHALAEIKIDLFEFSKKGLSLTLFLIGLGLSKNDIKKVGVRAILHACVLWGVITIGSLAWVMQD
jgi:uncharacterized integral membrane protein (TIGR00698 family)